MFRTPPRLWTVAPAIGLLTLIGCGSDPAPNRTPSVQIASGPVEGSEVDYRIVISWIGTDPDGRIDRYEYATDPPPDFSEEEIAAGGPGITTEFLAGDAESPDRTRVTKVVDGGLVSFDWIHTRETAREFVFSADEPESMMVGGQLQPTGRFLGMHALYVRAVDDEGARSEPDEVAFTAETVAPTATITRPTIDMILQVGASISIEWTGTDPDRGNGGRPVGYLVQLLDLRGAPICAILDCIPTLLRAGTWTRVEGSDGSTTFDLDTPAPFAFAVRAVDEAGAVEPFLEYGRNMFRFSTRADAGTPILSLHCGGITATFPPEEPYSLELPAFTDIVCEVACSAESYGETCAEYRWGVDLADLEQEEGWSDWVSTGSAITLSGFSPSIRVLYIQARDSLGQVVLGAFVLNIVDFPLDKEILLVDDSFDDTYPRDDQSDDFWASLLQGYGSVDPANVATWAMYGDLDRGSLNPRVPRLAELGRYRTLVWDNRGSGYNGVSGLFLAVRDAILDRYLVAGGQLWLSGRLTVAAMTPGPSGQLGDFVYPKLDLGPGDFAYDFLKLHTDLINNDKGASPDGRHNLSAAQPFPGRPETYPLLEVDTGKQQPLAVGRGIPGSDAVFDPLLAHAEPGFRGVIDSLYVYGATGNLLLGRNSLYHQRLTGLRWHDPDPDREHGRIQWFGFPMYFMQDAQAQETFNRSLDWFREETAGSP